jgi:hypothetical protein
MAYKPTEDHLPERDQTFLAALRDKFLRSLLGKVGPNSVRGHIIGKILEQAERRGISWHAVLAQQLPVTVEAAERQIPLTMADRLAIHYAEQHAAATITQLADDTLAAVRSQVAQALAANTPPKELARQLFDRFGEANLDWRRIALTETAAAVSNGYLTSLPEWTIVVGDSSADACDWCKAHINMRAFRSLREAPEPAAGDQFSQDQSDHYVWPGKTNLGRSRHPVDRTGVSRKPHELWHPCIPAHPHCRCRWRRLIESVETIRPGTNLVVPK